MRAGSACDGDAQFKKNAKVREFKNLTFLSQSLGKDERIEMVLKAGCERLRVWTDVSDAFDLEGQFVIRIKKHGEIVSSVPLNPLILGNTDNLSIDKRDTNLFVKDYNGDGNPDFIIRTNPIAFSGMHQHINMFTVDSKGKITEIPFLKNGKPYGIGFSESKPVEILNDRKIKVYSHIGGGGWSIVIWQWDGHAFNFESESEQ
jgi:hypothetical protein